MSFDHTSQIPDGVSPPSGETSTANTTTTPLGSGATYTGTGEQNNYGHVGVSCQTDNAGTLYFDFSSDNTNWTTFPVNGFRVASGIHEFHTAVKLGRYFRVRLVNDSGAQSYLRLYTYYGENFLPSNTPMNQSIGVDNDSLIIRTGNDFNLDLARSFIGGQSGVSKFGTNPNVSASSTEDITFSGTINFLTAATAVRIKSGGNVNDTAAGSGAQQVTIVGLDENWEEASETIATNGNSASSATTTTFIRVFRAYVGNVGTYGGNNAGNITIENSTGGTDLVTIEAGRGQTQISLYTVPAGKTAYLVRIRVGSTSSKASDIRLWQRQDADDVTTPFTGKRLIRQFLGVTGSRVVNFNSYPPFPAKTDLWGSVTTASGGAGAVELAYDLVLVDN